MRSQTSKEEVDDTEESVSEASESHSSIFSDSVSESSESASILDGSAFSDSWSPTLTTSAAAASILADSVGFGM